MGLCLSAASDNISTISSVRDHEKEYPSKNSTRNNQNLTKTTEPSRKPHHSKLKKRQIKSKKVSGKQNKRNNRKRKTLGHKDDKWSEWQLSEETNRIERKVKKQRFLGQYQIDDLKRGTLVYEERRGLYADEIDQIEDSFENAVKKERRMRRQRKVNESFSWSMF